MNYEKCSTESYSTLKIKMINGAKLFLRRQSYIVTLSSAGEVRYIFD